MLVCWNGVGLGEKGLEGCCEVFWRAWRDESDTLWEGCCCFANAFNVESDDRGAHGNTLKEGEGESFMLGWEDEGACPCIPVGEFFMRDWWVDDDVLVKMMRGDMRAHGIF